MLKEMLTFQKFMEKNLKLCKYHKMIVTKKMDIDFILIIQISN